MQIRDLMSNTVIRIAPEETVSSKTRVREVMTGGVVWATPDLDAALAARLMGRKQIRRLPVVADNKLCGMISLGDLANCDENAYDAGDALAEISSNVSTP